MRTKLISAPLGMPKKVCPSNEWTKFFFPANLHMTFKHASKKLPNIEGVVSKTTNS
jgi:hypothetical protein